MYRPKQLKENADLSLRNIPVGMWGWILQRITGLLLVFYLMLHILVVSVAMWGGQESFDRWMHGLHNPVLLTLELGLILTVIYHALNGLRIVLFDLGYGIRAQRQVFAAVMVLTALIFGYSLYVIVPYIY